jgi:hypothetical protein
MSALLKYYAQPAFLLCVALLAFVAGGVSWVKSYFSLWLVKEPIELKKSLDDMDESRLAPFIVKDKIKIPSNDIVDSLGTQDYLEWVLVDSQAEQNSPVGSLLLFITYYGKADSVPHVPEECYTGGGYRKVSSDPITFELANAAELGSSSGRKIPGRYVTFRRASSEVWSSRESFPVLYLFNVNRIYTNNRTDARFILGRNIRGKHSYFSKVEMVFNRADNPPDKETAIAVCEKLLDVLLPVLEQDHWPDENDLAGSETK